MLTLPRLLLQISVNNIRNR